VRVEFYTHILAYEDGTNSVPKRRYINFRRRGITQNKSHNVYGAFANPSSRSNYLQHHLLPLLMNNYKEARSGRGLTPGYTITRTYSKLRNPITTLSLCFRTPQAAMCVQCVALLFMVVPKRPVVFEPCQNVTCR